MLPALYFEKDNPASVAVGLKQQGKVSKQWPIVQDVIAFFKVTIKGTKGIE